MRGVVRIAGAGPSGLAAAIVLARAGRRVEVLEEKPSAFPRGGQRTEGLRNYGPVDALEELRSFGLDVKAFGIAQTTIRHSRLHENRLDGPAYYLVTRGSGRGTLDAQLLEESLRMGVSIRYGERAAPGDVDIVATGTPQSKWRLRSVGFTFSRVGSRLGDSTVHALLDEDIAPGGYLAIAPGPEGHSLYLVSWKDLDPKSLARRLERAVALPWIREIIGTSGRIGSIEGGAGYVRDPISTAVDPSGALRVGEAGGFQDPIAGYGVRYALLTGALGARSIIEGLDYTRLLRETFKDEFERAYEVREQLNKATNEDFDRFVASLGTRITLEAYRRHRMPWVI